MPPASAPRALILSSGSEITQGMYADTNAMELSRVLTRHGFRVVGHAALPDDLALLVQALCGLQGRCELAVMTGGLGPTEDDLTREAVCEARSLALHRVHRAELMMRERFTARGVAMPENNLRQADLPSGSQPLLNHWGTAPGFVLPAAGAHPVLVAMPGVPHEWRAMVERHFARHVLVHFPERPATTFHALHIALLPESLVNRRVQHVFARDPRVEVTILAGRGQIQLRFLGRASGEQAAADAMGGVVAAARAALPPDAVFADGPERATLEGVVVERFLAAGRTCALAESCTGGGVAKRLTDIPGSSSVLLEGFVTYSNAAKARQLGVQAATLDDHGAVSAACVLEMAAGARRASGADVAVSISGIAGPTGGSEEKPVGTVWFGLSGAGRQVALHRRFPGDRAAVRAWAENQALDLLRRWVCDLPLEPPVD